MADERTYNVEDRIQELGEDPATAYARANAAGMAGNAPAPTPLNETPTSLETDTVADPLIGLPASAPAPKGPVVKKPKPDPFAGEGPSIVAGFQGTNAAPAAASIPVPSEQLSTGHTGTIGDAEQDATTADYHQAPAVTDPIEPPSTFSALFGASFRSGQRDNPLYGEKVIHDGYAPIIRALGLSDSENPANYGEVDSQGEARFGSFGSPSDLATKAQQGEQVPFSSNFLADRPLQESLVAAEIHNRRATDPNFLPGVPETVAGLHAYFKQQQLKQNAADQSIIARGPGGLTSLAVKTAGGAAAGVTDPINDMAFAIPGGEGAGLLRVAARTALINGVLAIGQQPLVYSNRKAMGEDYTLADAAESVAGATVAGAVLGGAGHGVGAGIKASGIPQAISGAVSGAVSGASGVAANAADAVGRGYDTTVSKIFQAMPEAVQSKWASRMKVGDMPASEFFQGLDNHELVSFVRDMNGGKLNPDQQSYVNVIERAQDVGASSPLQPGPVGDGVHDSRLQSAMKALIDHELPDMAGLPSGPAVEGTGAASPAAAPERPPAPSTVGRPQPQDSTPGDPEAAIQHFMGRVDHVENATGNPNAKNPRSSASGPSQFTDPTFREYYQKVYGRDPGEHPASELKNDPTVQAHLLDELTRNNASRLQQLGETLNDGNLYLMHFLGEGNGAKVFKADPATPIEQLVSHKVIEANPFLAGKSASEVIAWAHGKMGVHVSSVGAGAHPLTSAVDDFRNPQLNDDALQNDDMVIGDPSPSSGWGGSEAADESAREVQATPLQLPPMYVRTVSNGDINVDAERFQFKSGGDANGVTDRLRGLGPDQWNPLAAGSIGLWEDNSGKLFVADGHQRIGYANRITEATGKQVPMTSVVMREADGVTAESARVYAALKNIGEFDGERPSHAQLVDAAKVARGIGPEELLKFVPPKSSLARDGAALARLSDRAFGAVYNDVVPADFAAVIGHLLPHSPETHEAMINLLAELDPANRGQAASIVRQAIAAGIHKEEQIDLFGTHQHVTSLMLEKAKITERVLNELRNMKKLHKTAAEGSATLEKSGSKIAVEQSKKEAEANAQAIETVNRLAYRAGPVADAINGAAADLKSGRGKLAALARTAAERIRELDLGSLDSGSAADTDAGEQPSFFARPNSDAERAAPSAYSGDAKSAGADGQSGSPGDTGGLIPGEIGTDQGDSLGIDGPGRGDEPLEEGSQLPTQPGDQEQPQLHELEQATQRFSDPDGPAFQQQAKSLYHDLKVDTLTRREKIQAATAALEGRGELRTVEPFPEEPGYHRFRYVSADGEAVTGNYTVDGNTIEGFNIGDTNNPKALGPKEMRNLFEQLAEQHPDTKYVHGYRMSGARTETGAGEAEVWFELTDKGIKRIEGEPADANAAPEPANKAPARESEPRATEQPQNGERAENGSNELLGADQGVDPAIAERNRQLVDLKGEAPLRAPGDVDQAGEIGLPLMDHADQGSMTFRIGDEGEEMSAEDLLADLEADDKAIKAIKDCL